MTKYLITLLAITLTTVSIAQKPKGEVIDDRLLTWPDFKGKKPSNTGFKAMTYYLIQVESDIRDNKYVFDVLCKFDSKKSWVDKKYLKNSPEGVTQHLLKHEQGHYDIGRVMSAEMEHAFNSFSFDSKRIRYQSDSIRRFYMAKLKKLELDYDKETDHCRELDEQKRWNEKIEKALTEKKFD